MTAQRMQPSPRAPTTGCETVLRRLGGFGALPRELSDRVRMLGDRSDRLNAGALIQREGDRAARPRYLLEGWAFRFRDLSDGRRQIFDFVLPGDGVGVCLRPHAFAATTVALTPVVLGDATPLMAEGDQGVALGYAALLQRAADADERRLLSALTRLGRMSALERLAHLLLEVEERLRIIGLAGPEGFPLPATQETLADVLGLSVVHINRTLQELRRQGVVAVARGHVRIQDRRALETLADL